MLQINNFLGEKVVLVGDTGAARYSSDFLSWSQERVQEAGVGPGQAVLTGVDRGAPECSLLQLSPSIDITHPLDTPLLSGLRRAVHCDCL